jgi:predicted transcriptional regulator
VNKPSPSAAKVSLRSFRVEDEIWEAAQAVAATRDETLSQVLRRALKEYAGEPPAKRRTGH